MRNKANKFLNSAIFMAVFLLVGAMAVVSFAGLAQAEEPVLPEDVPTFLDEVGTSFVWEDLTFTSDTSIHMNVTIANAYYSVFSVESDPQAPTGSATLTVQNLAPLTSYYLYVDDAVEPVEMQSDVSGSLSFSQDVSTKHLLQLQDSAGTVRIYGGYADGFECTLIGTWDALTDTCTITAGSTVTDDLILVKFGATLDGNKSSGAKISFTGTGSAVRISDDYSSMVNTRIETTLTSGNSVFIYGGSNHLIKNNDVVEYGSGTGMGYYITQIADSTFLNNTIEKGISTTFRSFFMSYSNNNTIDGLTGTHNNRNSHLFVDLTGPSSGNNFTNLTNNGPVSKVINVYGGGPADLATNNTFSNVTNNTTSKWGVYTTYADNITVNNFTGDFDFLGFYIYQYSTNINIHNADVTARSYGAFVYSPSALAEVTFTASELSPNNLTLLNTTGIYAFGANSKVTLHNIDIQEWANGIRLDGNADLTMTGTPGTSRVQNNDYYDILINESSKITAGNNVLADNAVRNDPVTGTALIDFSLDGDEDMVMERVSNDILITNNAGAADFRTLDNAGREVAAIVIPQYAALDVSRQGTGVEVEAIVIPQSVAADLIAFDGHTKRVASTALDTAGQRVSAEILITDYVSLENTGLLDVRADIYDPSIVIPQKVVDIVIPQSERIDVLSGSSVSVTNAGIASLNARAYDADGEEVAAIVIPQSAAIDFSRQGTGVEVEAIVIPQSAALDVRAKDGSGEEVAAIVIPQYGRISSEILIDGYNRLESSGTVDVRADILDPAIVIPQKVAAIVIPQSGVELRGGGSVSVRNPGTTSLDVNAYDGNDAKVAAIVIPQSAAIDFSRQGTGVEVEAIVIPQSAALDVTAYDGNGEEVAAIVIPQYGRISSEILIDGYNRLESSGTVDVRADILDPAIVIPQKVAAIVIPQSGVELRGGGSVSVRNPGTTSLDVNAYDGNDAKVAAIVIPQYGELSAAVAGDALEIENKGTADLVGIGLDDEINIVIPQIVIPQSTKLEALAQDGLNMRITAGSMDVEAADSHTPHRILRWTSSTGDEFNVDRVGTAVEVENVAGTLNPIGCDTISRDILILDMPVGTKVQAEGIDVEHYLRITSLSTGVTTDILDPAIVIPQKVVGIVIPQYGAFDARVGNSADFRHVAGTYELLFTSRSDELVGRTTVSNGEKMNVSHVGELDVRVENTGTVTFDVYNTRTNVTSTLTEGQSVALVAGPTGTIAAKVTSNMVTDGGATGQQPLANATVKAYDTADSCVALYLPDANQVNANCAAAATCLTDASGECEMTALVGNYFVLVEEANHQGIYPSHNIGYLGEDQVKKARLAFLIKDNIKSPGKTKNSQDENTWDVESDELGDTYLLND